MAAITDKLRKGAPAFSTTLAADKGAGASSATLSSAATIPTTTAVDFTIGRVDANGNKTPATKAVYKATLSGSTISNLTLVEGTDQLHKAGTPVEITFTAATWNDMVDWGLTQHNQDGTHSNIIATTLSTTGNATVGGNASIAGNLSVTGTSTLTGNTSVTGTLTSTGILSLPSANKTTDANGWTIYNYGAWKKYIKVGKNSSVAVATLNRVSITISPNLPVGMSTLGTAGLTASFISTDAALTVNIGAASTSSSVGANVYNSFNGGTVTADISWTLEITTT